MKPEGETKDLEIAGKRGVIIEVDNGANRENSGMEKVNGSKDSSLGGEENNDSELVGAREQLADLYNGNGRKNQEEERKKQKTISCIVAAYNEAGRVRAVIEELIKISNLEIICVDDGSDDCGVEEIKEQFPEVKFLRLEKNTGKSRAVFEGLKYASGEYILLMDADLQGLDHKEIAQALENMQQAKDVDMALLRKVNAPWNRKLFHADLLLTGERIIKKTDLEIIASDTRSRGYGLEVLINRWMEKKNKKVVWMPYSGTDIHKFSKEFSLSRIWQDFKTFRDMFSAVGFINLMKQILSTTRHIRRFEK